MYPSAKISKIDTVALKYATWTVVRHGLKCDREFAFDRNKDHLLLIRLTHVSVSPRHTWLEPTRRNYDHLLLTTGSVITSKYVTLTDPTNHLMVHEKDRISGSDLNLKI